MSSVIIHGTNSRNVRTSVSVPEYMFRLFSASVGGDDDAKREIREALAEYPVTGELVSRSIQNFVLRRIVKPSLVRQVDERQLADDRAFNDQLDIEDEI